MTGQTSEIVRKQVHDIQIAGIRYHGRYEDSETYFGRLVEQVGERVDGALFCLFSDENSALGVDIEYCLPVTEAVETEEVGSRVLRGGAMVCVRHTGPASTLGESWGLLYDYIEGQNLRVVGPRREIILEGEEIESRQLVVELQVPVAG